MKSGRLLLFLAVVFFVSAALVGAVSAAAGGSFVFDYPGDVGDNADGPQYNITLVSPTDDGGGCDAYVMVMIDPNGTVVDVDPGCVSGGLASDDGDYGILFAPSARPITYTLFDIDGADAAVLSGISESDPAYLSYLLANGVCLDEDYEDLSSDLTGLPTAAPFTLCGGGTVCLGAPVGSVVGDAPFNTQAYYEPGNVAPGVVLNPGTYVVIGQDESETYYKIVLSCQYLWVRKDTMQPSFLPPQNGAPLPTRIVG